MSGPARLVAALATIAVTFVAGCGGAATTEPRVAGVDLQAVDACLQSKTDEPTPGGPQGGFASGLPASAVGKLAFVTLYGGDPGRVKGYYAAYVVVADDASEARTVRDAVRDALQGRGDPSVTVQDEVTWLGDHGNAAWYVFPFGHNSPAPDLVRAAIEDCIA